VGNDSVTTVYRLSNAFSRALIVLIAGLAVGVLMGSTANADEPSPRAVPEARSMPRAFASYDALIAYAAGVAADQSALDARLAAVRAQARALGPTLQADVARGARGGSMFDPDPRRSARSTILAQTERQLIAAGALTSPTGLWGWPTVGVITQPFGPTSVRVEPARTYGGVYYPHFHDGVDLAGDWMAPVAAPARGRVVFVGRMVDGAEVVVLAHDDGLVSLYAHLDAASSPPPVAAGDEVAAGQRIGTVGRTGIAYGMHLHWAVYRNGEFIDPLRMLGY
jgi:murein DD-endopeptidase MepM/ murein hydrolase activator NlpD